MNDRQAGALMACVYFALVGFFVGQMVLRRQQRRDAWESDISNRLFDVEHKAKYAANHAQAAYDELFNKTEPEPEPEKPAKK